MPDGPLGDIWDECTNCGKQGNFDKAKDRHLPPEKLIKDFTFMVGMTRCPSCKRLAWELLSETLEGNVIIYKERCKICGQLATCEQINLKL